jgi:hypothetical protein
MKIIQKSLSIWFLILFSHGPIMAQQSFEVVYGSDYHERLSYTFEDNNGNYISVGGNFGDPYFGSPIILKIDQFGNIIQDKVFTKIDTNYYFHFGFQKSNGNYFIMGTLSDTNTISKKEITYFTELNEDFDVVWENFYTIPEPYLTQRMLEFIFDADSNILLQGKVDSSFYSIDDLLYIQRVSQQGEVLDFKLFEGWKDYSNYGAFIHNYDSSGYVLYGKFPQGSAGYAREWVELNLDLEITSFVSIIDPEHYVSSPLSAKWLSNGNLMVADIATMEPGANKDLYIKTMDQDLNVINDTLIYYDDQLYLPNKNGLDFTDENNIWVGAYVAAPTSWPGTEVFRIHIFDAQVNLKAMKEYGGNMRYEFRHLIATSDGGCIMTGSIPDYDGAENSNGYLIKVMPFDILTHAEKTPSKIDRDVAIFPNPFKNYIFLTTARKSLSFTLSSAMGEIVIKGNLNSIQTKIITDNLVPGIYFYTIFENGKAVQTGKLIKQ